MTDNSLKVEVWKRMKVLLGSGKAATKGEAADMVRESMGLLHLTRRNLQNYYNEIERPPPVE